MLLIWIASITFHLHDWFMLCNLCRSVYSRPGVVHTRHGLCCHYSCLLMASSFTDVGEMEEHQFWFTAGFFLCSNSKNWKTSFGIFWWKLIIVCGLHMCLCYIHCKYKCTGTIELLVCWWSDSVTGKRWRRTRVLLKNRLISSRYKICCPYTFIICKVHFMWIEQSPKTRAHVPSGSCNQHTMRRVHVSRNGQSTILPKQIATPKDPPYMSQT